MTPWHAPGPCQVYPHTHARAASASDAPTMASSTSPISASRVSSRASIVGARRIPGARGPSTSRACSRGGLITTEAIFGRGRKVESVKVEEQVEQEVEAPPAIEPPIPEPALKGTELTLSTDESCDDADEYCSYFDLDSDGRLAEPLEAAIPMDYYSLLQLDFEATDKDVKRQYRQLQKWCHPDIAGEAGNDLSIILNEAYDTLMDEKTRRVYDKDLKEMRKQMDLAMELGADFKPYTGQPMSKFVGQDPTERGSNARAVFVNEAACIGCRQCNHSAPNTFMMEDEWGRARAFQQWADSEEDITIAIESCPVDCIYWVKQRNLPILEYAMQRVERVSVGMMNQGSARVGDPFDVANTMIRKGEEERMRVGMDASGAEAGMASAGKLGARIRLAWLNLGENVRGRWSAYDEARSSYMASMSFDEDDDGNSMDGDGEDPCPNDECMMDEGDIEMSPKEAGAKGTPFRNEAAQPKDFDFE